MRAARSLSTRLVALGSAVAIATVGLAGTAGIVATAGPAGASTSLGSTTCNLTTGSQSIAASIDAAITPTPVNAGNDFNVTGLVLSSHLTSDKTTTVAAGQTLTITFTANMFATNATPASQVVTFSGLVTIPAPFPIGSTAPVVLNGSVGAFTASTSGATSTAVSIDPSGTLKAVLGAVVISGSCTGGAAVQVASAPIIPAAGFIRTVIPNAGVSGGGTTVKLVGKNFSGATAVDFNGVPATNVQVLSPTVITCTSPEGPNVPYGAGDTQDVVNITVTTAAGPSKVQPFDQFTYVDPTLGAIVSSVSPGSGQPTGGTPVTITGIGFDGFDASIGTGTSVSFGASVIPVCDGIVPEPCATVVDDNTITTIAPAGTGIVNVTVIGADQSTPSPTSPQDRFNYNPGYFLAASDGGVFSYGQFATGSFFGSAGNLTLNKPVVGMAVTPDGGGYWLVASDGGIFAYGDATFYGSAGNLTLNKPIVGMSVTPDGAGYMLVAADGGVFTYGDALFYGSTGAITLNKPVVGVAGTPNGAGYWLVASDGGIFAYGDAVFYGSTGGTTLNKPVVGMAADSDGTGYSLVAADGGVFSYGTAKFLGSTGGTTLNKPVVGIDGINGGYWLVASDGGIFSYGNAPFLGSTGAIILNKPIVDMASTGVVTTSAA